MSVRWGVVFAIILGAAPVVASPTTRLPAVQLQRLLLAQTVDIPGRLSQAVLQMPDTLRVRMLAAIARGDIAGAIALWELETGHQAPLWLQAMQEAFSTANQRAGPCIEVARSIFEGFRRLGANPSYLRLSAQGSRFLGFEMRAGKPSSTVQVSELQMHLVVQVKDRVYDAFTGPAGLPVSEYLKRLVTEEGATITSQVVGSP
jgi:hypothetical protein